MDRLKGLGCSTSGSQQALADRLRLLSSVAKPKAGAPSAPEKRGASRAAEEPPSKRQKAEAKTIPMAAAAKVSAPKANSKSQAAGSKRAVDDGPKFKAPKKFYFEDGDFRAEYAKSSKAGCKKCKEKIAEGALRIGKQVPSDKFDGMITVWQHWTCFCSTGLLPRTTQLIQGFSTLRPEDQEKISKYVPASVSTGNAKRDAALKAQSQKVYEVQDHLKKLGEQQLKDMLELNNYPSKKLGTQTTIKDLCADGILFGATAKCKICGGSVLLTGEGYRCRGWVSEFLPCTFKTQTPARLPWKLTPAANKFLGSALGKLKGNTGQRVFAGAMRNEDEAAAAAKSSSDQKIPPFLGMTFMVLEKGDKKSKAELEKLITSNAGSVSKNVSRAAHCVISHTGIVKNKVKDHKVVAEAKELGVPGAKEGFLLSSQNAGIVQDLTPHLLWGEARKASVIKDTTSKFIEKQGVSMDSDVGELVKTAHVLVDKASRSVYSEMLTKTDMVSGSNSFYTLHLLESDARGEKKYYVFKKWGRIGVSQGGSKVEEYGANLAKAINEFKGAYFKQTGNVFGQPVEFVAKAGKMVRVEIEHKALSGKQSSGKAGGNAVDGGDQPLGKLSKAQIEKGQVVLGKVDKLMASASNAVAKEKAASNFLALSAEYYTMIPHNFGSKKPPVIDKPELLGAEQALLAFSLRMGFEDLADAKKLTPISGVMDLPLPKTLQECAKSVCAAKNIKECVDKGTTMFKKKAGKPKVAMTPDLYGAILLYTSNAICKQLNQALRDEDRRAVQAYFKYLRFLFEACARLPTRKVTLWRGVGVDLFPTYKVGSTIIWWGVSSCTSDESVARNFMAGCGDGATLLTVETQTACDISEVSFFANEAESILLPGTQLKVISSKRQGAKSEIRLKEFGRVVS